MLYRYMADESVLVPMRAEDPRGTVGDALIRLRPGDPGYAEAKAKAIADHEHVQRARGQR
jgi:hypothetical protein